MFSCRTLVLMSIVTLLVAGGWNFVTMKRVNIPDHLLGHPATFLEDFLTADQADRLMALAKEMKDFPPNAADLKFYDILHEHIGEAQPRNADGQCDHPYMIPSNTNSSMCVLAGRIDLSRHYMMGGGVEGMKEPYDEIVSRLFSFARYVFDPTEYQVVDELMFESDKLREAAKAVCPKDKQKLDPFQFTLLCQLPGQTVPLHLDAPYFWGATRFQFPQWLLVVMKFSGLFEEEFIDQVQVVAYFHRWNNTEERGGKFVYWDQNERHPHQVPPVPLAGTVVDGSKTIHAGIVYRPDLKAPLLDKSAESNLQYVGEDKWELTNNGSLIASYVTDDIRWTLVYRARCFAEEDGPRKFRNWPRNKYMKLDEILSKLKADLVHRGRMTALGLDQMNPLDLAVTLLDEYISYPLSPTAVLPYNYCVLGKLYPSIQPLLDLVC